MHDPVGERYGQLTILRYTGRKYKNGDRYVAVLCDCGTEKEMTYPSVKSPRGSRSCGCQRWRGTHRMSGTPIYRAWQAMHSRCYSSNDAAFADYGDRGITVTRRWHTFERFYEDMAKGFRPGLVLDRIHNDQPYRRTNCRWLTRAESNRNMRTNLIFLVEGRTLCLAELVREYGTAKYSTAQQRHARGCPIHAAIGRTDKTLNIREIDNAKI